jgi:hypothetical protein
MLFILEAGAEKLLTFVKEKLRMNKKLSNGHTTETKIKFGLLNQSGDYKYLPFSSKSYLF